MNRTTKSAGVGQHSNGMRRKHPRTPSPLIPFPSRSLRLTTDAHQVRRKIEFILCRTEHSSFRFLAWSAASPTLFNIDTYKPCLQNVAFRAREDAVSTKSLNGFCCVVSVFDSLWRNDAAACSHNPTWNCVVIQQLKISLTNANLAEAIFWWMVLYFGCCAVTASGLVVRKKWNNIFEFTNRNEDSKKSRHQPLTLFLREPMYRQPHTRMFESHGKFEKALNPMHD